EKTTEWAPPDVSACGAVCRRRRPRGEWCLLLPPTPLLWPASDHRARRRRIGQRLYALPGSGGVPGPSSRPTGAPHIAPPTPAPCRLARRTRNSPPPFTFQIAEFLPGSYVPQPDCPILASERPPSAGPFKENDMNAIRNVFAAFSNLAASVNALAD